MIPNSLAHALITGYGLVTDSWLALHPNNPLVPESTTQSAEYNITELGVTCDSVLNTWRTDGKILSPQTPDPRGKRLDYIFYSDTLATARNIKVGCTDLFRLPSGEQVSLSDHFSVELELDLKPSPDHVARQLETQQRLVEVDESASGLIPVTDALMDTISRTLTHEEPVKDIKTFTFKGKPLPLELIDEILELSRLYMAREVEQSRWRIWHFWVSLVVLIGIHIAVWWWNVAGGAFLFVFLSWVVAVSGTLDGLIGFLFMFSGKCPWRIPRNSMLNCSRNGGAQRV